MLNSPWIVEKSAVPPKWIFQITGAYLLESKILEVIYKACFPKGILNISGEVQKKWVIVIV